ncbi:hypothetical protein PybrP1_002878 [[Pythium] brassicae (nom. inval.)]|nr:hypothetical protein PybrP1_002878 [[Pythium] brassicae (nom. inval.)]
MSFLDRFQNKIATVTAHGHLKKADGSEEIRVGPPKRRAKAPVESSTRAGAVSGKHVASNNGGESTHSATTSGKAVATANGGKSGSNLGSSSGYDNNHNHHDGNRTQRDTEVTSGHLKNDNCYDEPQTTARSYGVSKSPSPSPTRERHQRQQHYEHRGGNPPSPELHSRSPRGTSHDASPRKELKSPIDINEARVQSDADQLAFSRKARPVQYEPCKLSQYKKEKPAEYYELGKLQPDLNSDALVQKRANAERIKAFSKNLRVINKTVPPKKSESNNEAQSSAAAAGKNASTRSKALAFAKRIPKPKHSSRSSLEDGSGVAPTSNIQSIAPSSRPINSVLDDDSEDDEVSSELQQLQLRHQMSRAQVDALIKKS